MTMLLDPGMDLTLRPMRYPDFYERFRAAIRNTWTVEEVDLASDVPDLATLSVGERHLVHRLVAFFATGDSIVANNLVLNLYQHVNAPEARLYLSRQLYEEAVHVQFYLTLLDTYLPDHEERAKAFAAVEHIPSIRDKAEFCFRWIDSIGGLHRLETRAERRAFLLNLICFAAGCSSTAPSPTSTGCARAGCFPGWPPAPTGCSATSRCTWSSPSRWSTPSAPRSRRCSTRRWRMRCGPCWTRR